MRLRAVVLGLPLLWSAAAMAAEPVRLVLENHRFTPAEVRVPAGERFRIEVVNQDPTPAEFESPGLKVEKVVVPNGSIQVSAGPLKPGAYPFFDEYHPDTALGTVTAVQGLAEK
jgi:hypothetical protein